MLKKPGHTLFLKAASSAFLFLLVIFSVAMEKPVDDHIALAKVYNYLALGDSYTIGEQVEAKENFPNQVVAMLKERGIGFNEPRIIAQTGWTTDELQAAIDSSKTEEPYDLVTLLIGVNNQYRGQPVNDYIPEFESLLKQALHFAGNNPARVIILSIPDWGVTPFAEGRDRKQVAKEIDEYNSANQSIAKKYNVRYINITENTREAANDISLLADDKLHPSGKEYTRWAKKLAAVIQEKM